MSHVLEQLWTLHSFKRAVLHLDGFPQVRLDERMRLGNARLDKMAKYLRDEA